MERSLLKVGFFATCLVDLMRPQAGLAALRLLGDAGITNIAAPRSQTCCGQPAYNGGYRNYAQALARKCAAEFADCERVVIPSGSCAAMFRIHYPRLFSPDAPEYPAICDFAAKCRELCEFLEEINFHPSPPPATKRIEESNQTEDAQDGTAARIIVTYHDSCAGLRELGIKDAPRRLLSAAGVRVIEMKDAEECCGFGGTFAIKFGDISAKMAAVKCKNARAAAAAIVMGDVGCILNIEGRLKREGDDKTKVLHIAEALSPNDRAA
jgi:L-lactate dehydrogenase complex protein LldE